MRSFVVMAAVFAFSTPALEAMAQGADGWGEPTALPPPPPEPPPRGGLARLQRGAETHLRTSHLALRLDTTDDPFTSKISAGEAQNLALSFTPRGSFIDTGRHWLFAETELRLNHRLGRKPRSGPEGFGDLPLWAGYQLAVLRDPEVGVVRVGPRLGVTLPTSDASDAARIAVRTTAAFESTAQLPLRDGLWLNGLFLQGTAAWRHTFGKYVGGLGDTLPGEAPGAAPDRIALAFRYELNLVDELSVRNRWGMTWDGKKGPSAEPCEVYFATGCAAAGSSPNATTASTVWTPWTTFDVSLGYVLSELALFEVGYENTSLQIGADGKNRSVFHGPDARFFVSATLLLDELVVANNRRMKERAARE